MSLNVINPDQVFRDTNGIPRAFGLLTFFNNLTAVKATIYSDEDLKIEQNNPYELDAYGRVTADIKYAGLLTLQATNADGSDVRTEDNVGNTPPLGSGINIQTGTAYPIAPGDNGIVVSGEHATDIAITLLSTTAAGDQWKGAIIAGGAGTVSIIGTIGGRSDYVLNPGETLVYWGDGTVYKGFVVPVYQAPVTNYSTGRIIYLRSDTGIKPTYSLNINLTESTYVEIGPTNSGATKIWTGLDAIPLDAVGIILTGETIWNDSVGANIMSHYIRARINGGTDDDGIRIAHTEARGEAGLNYLGSGQRIIPIDSANIFEAYWTSNADTTQTANIYLDGFILP